MHWEIDTLMSNRNHAVSVSAERMLQRSFYRCEIGLEMELIDSLLCTSQASYLPSSVSCLYRLFPPESFSKETSVLVLHSVCIAAYPTYSRIEVRKQLNLDTERSMLKSDSIKKLQKRQSRDYKVTWNPQRYNYELLAALKTCEIRESGKCLHGCCPVVLLEAIVRWRVSNLCLQARKALQRL